MIECRFRFRCTQSTKIPENGTTKDYAKWHAKIIAKDMLDTLKTVWLHALFIEFDFKAKRLGKCLEYLKEYTKGMNIKRFNAMLTEMEKIKCKNEGLEFASNRSLLAGLKVSEDMGLHLV